MSRTSSFSQVIQNRGFLNLWTNQLLVQLSYNSLNFALIIWVFRLTDSNTAVSALLFAIYLPAVVFSLFAGVLVDITDRRLIIRTINILLSIAFFSLIFLKMNYAAILLIVFFANSLAQFYVPAESSAIPIVTKKYQLLMANAIFTTTLYVSFLLGFGLAGPLISHLGLDFVFGFGGVLLMLAFLLSFLFPPIRSKAGLEGKKLIRAIRVRDLEVFYQVAVSEIKQTLRLIRGKLLVLSSIMILAGVQMVIGVLAVLTPSFLEKTLQITATDASYVLVVPLGVGMVLGGFLMAKAGHLLPRRRIVGSAITIGGLLFVLMGLAPVLWPAIQHFHRPRPLPFFYQLPLSKIMAMGSFLLGITMVSVIAPAQTVLQENTQEHNRGKIFAVLGVMMAGLSLLPVLISGILADFFGAGTIFIAVGVIILLIGLFTLSPSLFFKEGQLPFEVREFLGLGHWRRE